MLPARIEPRPGLDAGPVAAREAELRSVLVFPTKRSGQNIALVLKLDRRRPRERAPRVVLTEPAVTPPVHP